MTSVLSSSAASMSSLSSPALLKQTSDNSSYGQQQRQPGSYLHQQPFLSSNESALSASLSAPHRPTSAPPDLELNTGNVFAFGLRNFAHFRHHDGDHGALSGSSALTVDAAHLDNPIRQPLVDDSQQAWPSSSHSSPRSATSRIQLPSSFLPAHPAHSAQLNERSSSHDAEDDDLQHAVDVLSLQDSATHVGGLNGSSGLSLHSQSSAAAFSKPPAGMFPGSSAPFSDLPSSASELSGPPHPYLYNLNLQQSLLSSLNLSALSPGQLALVQQQMQRLSSLSHEEQQKMQLLQLQQQQQALLMQQQMQMQAGGYSRGLYNAANGGLRGYRGGGRDVIQPPGGDRLHSRRGRDERGHGDRQFQHRKYGKPHHGYRAHDSRSLAYGGVFGQADSTNYAGETKLLSPRHPLSPIDPSHPFPCSSDPDDFSSSSIVNQFSPSSTIEELTSHIYLIAKDQYGCRLLQRMLDDHTPPSLCDLVFSECYEHINELMTDPFANYLMQKLIEHCHEAQRVAIITKASSDLVAIALNMHGTRAVQKLVESVSSTKEIECLTAALRSSVVTLIKDLNGNHVIQRCLHHLSSNDNQFIYDAVSRHCVSVSTHKHGCCVLQRCIDYATSQQKRQLITEIVNNSLELVQDQFGNYVSQYVLDLGDAQTIAGIITQLLGNISGLSVQKFSSNVIEKCLELANDKQRTKIIDELMNLERLPRLLQDPYGNYVIQKALSVSRRQQFERLVFAIKPHLLLLKNTSFGKRISHKIARKFPHLVGELELDEPASQGGAGGAGSAGGRPGAYGHGMAAMNGGAGGINGLRGYSNLSPTSALHHAALMQQQVALQQLSQQQQQGGLGSSNPSLPFAVSQLQGSVSSPSSSLSDYSELHQQQQPVGTGANGHYALLNHGMSHLSSYSSSQLDPKPQSRAPPGLGGDVILPRPVGS